MTEQEKIKRLAEKADKEANNERRILLDAVYAAGRLTAKREVKTKRQANGN